MSCGDCLGATGDCLGEITWNISGEQEKEEVVVRIRQENVLGQCGFKDSWSAYSDCAINLKQKGGGFVTDSKYGVVSLNINQVFRLISAFFKVKIWLYILVIPTYKPLQLYVFIIVFASHACDILFFLILLPKRGDVKRSPSWHSVLCSIFQFEFIFILTVV